MINISVEKAINIEKKRHRLAEISDYPKLLLTYKRNIPTIPNHNTPKYWDIRNFKTDTSKENNPMAWDKTSILIKWIKSIKSARNILDVGFGPGVVEDRILSKENNYSWYGIDISQESVDYVAHKYPKATFFKQSIFKIKFPDNTFDLVISSEILEHISPAKIFLALSEINRVLKKQGHILISIPLNEGLEKYLYRGENPIQHVRIYTPNIIKAELKIAGFKIIKCKLLYAFKNNYLVKSLVSTLFNFKKPNNLVLWAEKVTNIKDSLLKK